MKIEGQYHFKAPRSLVWEALLDPSVIARTLPGCRQLEPIGEHAYRGPLQVGVGPVQGNFEGEFALSELNPPEGYRIRIRGQGPVGFLEGEGRIRLEEREEGTDLHYDLDAEVGGRVASVGHRLLETTARVIARQGLQRLDEEIQKRRQAPSPPPAGPAEARQEEGSPILQAPPRLGRLSYRWVFVLGAVLLVLLLVVYFGMN